MNPEMYQQMMAQYLRSQAGGQSQANNQSALLDMMMKQQQGPQQVGGFMNPQMPQGGMGSMQGQLAPQQGIIRGA